VNCKDDVKNKDLQKKTANDKRSLQTSASKSHQKQTSSDISYLCEQSIKNSTESKIMSSTKRKIGEKVPPINSKRGISERFRKRIRLVTTELTSGPGKNDHELSSASRVEGGPTRKKLSSLKRKRLQETTDKLRHKKNLIMNL